MAMSAEILGPVLKEIDEWVADQLKNTGEYINPQGEIINQAYVDNIINEKYRRQAEAMINHVKEYMEINLFNSEGRVFLSGITDYTSLGGSTPHIHGAGGLRLANNSLHGVLKNTDDETGIIR